MLPIPSVSVAIPVHDGAGFLAEAIRIVFEQTYRDVEVVVLDNTGGEARAVARSFGGPRLRVESTRTPLSLPDAWNRAVELTRAPLVKLMRPDDLLHPRCLDLQVTPMESDPGLAVVAARHHLVDGRSRVIVPRRGLKGLTGVRTGVEVARRVVRDGANPIGGPGGVLFRHEDFVAAGGWRADRESIMDLDLWMRLLQYGEFLGLPEPLAAFRPVPTPGATSQERRRLVDELAGSDQFQVRGLDVTMGKVLAPVGRVRRSTLSLVSRLSTRGQDRLTV